MKIKLKTHIFNLIFLWRENRKEKVNTKINIDNILKIVSRAYKRKNSWVRNQTAVLIRKLRKEKPYRIQDYSEAKKFYETQPPGINIKEVSKGNYVVKHTENYAVKGKRWCEYYINFSSGTGVFKVGEWGDKWKSFRLEDCKERYGIYSLDEEDSIMFRFATDAEIKDFKNRRKKYLETKKEIDKKQEELSKLYQKL